MDKKYIMMSIIVALLIVIAVIGTYAYVVSTERDNSSDDSYVSNVETKSWHKIDSFNGVGDKTITLNVAENKMRVVSSAMPIKNYADNYMYTTVSNNGYNIGSSQLSWHSKSAVATKSDEIEFSGSGTYQIDVSTYELQYWNLEIYEYY